MKPKYLLDSDVFSLMVKGQDASINARLQTLGKGDAILSVVTTGEYFYGIAHAPSGSSTSLACYRWLPM
jgi:tRNA(fMet)-specific endonuclease VapC